MVIFEGKHFNHDWMKGEIPNTLYGIPFSGWIDQELFTDRMDAKTVYSKHTINTDSPTSLRYQFNPDVVRIAAEQKSFYFASSTY